MQSSDDGTQTIPKQPPPRDPDREFDWEKAYQFADGMLGLSELSFDSWKEDQHRQRKLKESPKGFPLDGRYPCAICGSHPLEDEQYWYDQNGIKCRLCQSAVDRGDIPASAASDGDSWYSAHDIEHSFSVKSKVVRRWVKEGALKPRNVMGKDGQSTHTQLFLIEDNKDTLPPKALLEGRSVKERTKDGQDAFYTEPWFCSVNIAEHLKGYKIVEHMQKLSENDWNKKSFKLSMVPRSPYLFYADPL